VDVSPENGSTELWLGTHKDCSVSVHDNIKVTPEALDKWRTISPPIQPTSKAGSILIRDIRLWHAGMPNHTDTPRPMIAMIHHAGWLSVGKLKFPKGTEEFSSIRICTRPPNLWTRRLITSTPRPPTTSTTRK